MALFLNVSKIVTSPYLHHQVNFLDDVYHVLNDLLCCEHFEGVLLVLPAGSGVSRPASLLAQTHVNVKVLFLIFVCILEDKKKVRK